jgi:hypothetical protein
MWSSAQVYAEATSIAVYCQSTTPTELASLPMQKQSN